MTILDSSDLKYLLIDTLRMHTEAVYYEEGNNPYLFRIHGEKTYIFIRNVHDSGENRDNDDECRLQFSSNTGFRNAFLSGIQILFLGYFHEENVFTAWDPQTLHARIDRRENVSVYSRFSTQREANRNGIALYVDRNNQHIPSFQPKFLGLYTANVEVMHHSDENTLVELAREIGDFEAIDIGETALTIDRTKFLVTRSTYKRNNQFRKNIYELYDRKCAICGIQLELVDAAHIVPHSHPKASDANSNGVCLCAIHHRAYDNGVIYFDENFRILINRKRIEYLQKIGRVEGLDTFQNLHGTKECIDFPNLAHDRPNINNIQLGNTIRGIE